MRILDGHSLVDRFGIAYFQNASVFGAVSEAAIVHLLEHGRVLQAQPGEILYRPGDRGDRFYVVLQGSLSFFQYYRGEFAYLKDHAFGEQIGFVAMIALHDRIGKVVAAQQSCVLEISSGLFHDLHQRFPTDFGLLLLNLSREMARTLRDVGELVVQKQMSRRAADRDT